MAIETKAKWARLKVGILAIAAMIILAVAIFLITGSTNIFEAKTNIFTYMSDAAALTEGAPVNINGIPIGKIKKIALSGSNDPLRIVRIDMEVPQSKLSQIPDDSIAAISAANVLGTKYINITKGRSQQTIRPGGEVRSLGGGDFEDLVKQGFSVLSSLQRTAQKIEEIVSLVETGQGSIGKLLRDETLYNNVLKILSSIQQLADVLNSDKGTFGKLIYSPELYNEVRGSLARADSLLQGMQEGQGAAGKFLKDPALYNELQQTAEDIHKITTDLNAGKGTAGKLLKSDELANQLQATIGKIDGILDRVNSGQGTIGQFMVNPQLYDNLNGASREMHELMKDFRANPKKFLRIKLSLF